MNISKFVKCLPFISLLLVSFPSFSKDWVYVVVPGDNIWSISDRFLTTVDHYEAVQKLNNVKFPRKMQPGTLLRIPLEWVAQHASKVKVVHINGTAQKISKSQMTTVGLDTEFALGDELRLAAKSSITLLFADSTKVNVNTESIIKFDHLTQYGNTGMVDTRIRIKSGKAEIQAAKQQGAGSRLDIAAASAITSVRGTVFRVGSQLDENNKEVAIVEVVEGKVSVEADGKDVDVDAGFGLSLTEGEALAEPKKLLDSPTLEQPLTYVSRTAIKVIWATVQDAYLYNVLISKDADFAELVWQTNTDQSQFEWPELADGNYYVRLTAIDAEGIEGLPNEFQTAVNLEPAPPMLDSRQVVLKNGLDQLSWQASSYSNLFRIQLSKSVAFNNLTVDAEINDTAFTPDFSMPVGDYYWRVATSDNEGGWGPFSVSEIFTYRSPIQKVSLKANPEDGNVLVSWYPLPESQHMEIEYALKKDFVNAERVVIKDDNELTVPIINDRLMYIRGRAIVTASKEQGDWSKLCRVNARKNFAICNI